MIIKKTKPFLMNNKYQMKPKQKITIFEKEKQ